jgi:cytochrome bd-type quinol oxidase subunit 2
MVFNHFWVVPLFSAVVWIAMLLGMFLTWIIDGQPIYDSMERGQTIAYISDVGAQRLKPLFVTGSIITVVSFDLVFISERWLRHRGTLERNTTKKEKFFSVVAMLFAVAGAAGLILLSIFDTANHPKLHDIFLAVFIAGYCLSAVFLCLEYWGLERHHRERKILLISFYIKFTFIIVEVALAIAFGVLQKASKWNTAAVLEWTIALIFTFYVLSFVIDFVPAARTDHIHKRDREARPVMRETHF